MTAVEWLVDKLDLNVFESDEEVADVINQAKEMEKEQIVEHSVELTKILISNPFKTSGKTPTELMDNYFKETFKQQEQ
jgi:hypothetical protein